jgi:DNA-binding MarR family transcriptional regulator
MLQGFIWFDEGLQTYLKEKGWQGVTRPQTMVMMAALSGVTRPSEIARMLGVSRQAVHTTIAGMIELGLLRLSGDPDDRRSKVVEITPRGRSMGEHARAATEHMVQALAGRIGAEKAAALREALNADWGPPLARFGG